MKNKNAKEQERGDILDIEYTNDKGKEVIVCKKTGIKTSYDPKTGGWKVGNSGRGAFGMSISVSGRGVRIYIISANPPICFKPILSGKKWELLPEGMSFPSEIVMGLIPRLDVATRVSTWLKRNPEYPKFSGCILPKSGVTQRLRARKTIQ